MRCPPPEQLLAAVQPGLLEEHLAPLRARVEQLLASKHLARGDIGRRIRILNIAARQVEPQHFKAVAGAVLQRKRPHIAYLSRSKNEHTKREISPQRLVHYQ